MVFPVKLTLDWHCEKANDEVSRKLTKQDAKKIFIDFILNIDHTIVIYNLQKIIVTGYLKTKDVGHNSFL